MRRLELTLQALHSLRDAGHQEIIVSFSGGKDSVAVLDLCHRVFERVHAFFLYVVPGLECEESILRRFEAKYGLKFLRLPSPTIANLLKSGWMVPHAFRLRRQLKFDDLYRAARKKTGAHYIALGHRMDESLQRRGMISSTTENGIDHKNGKVYPLAHWNAKSVYSYLRHRQIPMVDHFGAWDTTGLSFERGTLQRLRERFPGDYEKLCDVFPMLPAKVLRDEQRAAAGTGRQQRMAAAHG